MPHGFMRILGIKQGYTSAQRCNQALEQVGLGFMLGAMDVNRDSPALQVCMCSRLHTFLTGAMGHLSDG